MGLIKSTNAPAALTTFSMADIENQARAILLRARQQVDQLLAAAQIEGNRIRQNAYDEGFRAGQEDGLKKGTEDGRSAGRQAALAEHRAKLENLAKTLIAAVSEVERSRCQLESAAATEVIRLAIAIARRVTKLQGASTAEVVTENVRAAMRLVVHSADVRIAVHPGQKQLLVELLPQLRLAWPQVAHVEVMEDPALAPGGCRIVTAQGQVDADLDEQINRIALDLLPASPESSSP